MTNRFVLFTQVATRDPVELESRLRPLVKAMKIEPGDLYFQTQVEVYSHEDADWLKMVGGDAIRVEKWFVEVDGQRLPHRLHGPAGVLRPKDSDPIETWWLWGEVLKKDQHEAAIAAGVAEDQEAFKDWRQSNR